MERREMLNGEGETKVIRRTRVRVGCEYCGDPADQRHSYLLPNARSNPTSNAYRRDDCTWCSDHEVFTCQSCRNSSALPGSQPSVDGYGWCSTFSAGKGFDHMFLRWDEEEITEKEDPA